MNKPHTHNVDKNVEGKAVAAATICCKLMDTGGSKSTKHLQKMNYGSHCHENQLDKPYPSSVVLIKAARTSMFYGFS